MSAACPNPDCSRCLRGVGICKDRLADTLGVTLTAYGQLFERHQHQARGRGHVLELTPEQFGDLIEGDCAYCGAAPGNLFSICDAGHEFRFRYQGIDRVDNSRGYLPDNVVSCCSACNAGKNDHTRESFIERSRRIAERAGPT